MGLKYLGDLKWSEVTREERYFCCELYREVISRKDGLSIFLNYINEKLKTNIDVTADWELGYEVAFYRDCFTAKLSKSEETKAYSKFRKFDLCLFSESTILLIEAKAYSRFRKKELTHLFEDNSDYPGCDVGNIKKIAEENGVKINVYVLGLITSYYGKCIEDERFDGYLIWADLGQ